jgi:hypothetical protein
VEAGTDAIALSRSFATKQPSADAAVVRLLAAQEAPPHEVATLDDPHLRKEDPGPRGTGRGDRDTVERGFVGIERQESAGRVGFGRREFEGQDHSTFVDVKLFHASPRSRQCLPMVGSYPHHPGAPYAATKGESDFACVRVKVECRRICPNESSPDVGHSGEESARETAAVPPGEGEREIRGQTACWPVS